MSQRKRLRVSVRNGCRRYTAWAAFLLIATSGAKLQAQLPDLPPPEAKAEGQEAQAEAKEPKAEAKEPKAAGKEPKAEAKQASAWDDDWAFEGDLGLGTPTGFVGIVLERRVASAFALSAGVGWTGGGPQPALMGHLHVPTAPAVSLGFGVSGGGYRPLCILCEETVPVFDFALWNNYELSFEARGKAGFLVRGYFGMALLLNPNAYECLDCGAGERALVPEFVPYLGLAFGRSFG